MKKIRCLRFPLYQTLPAIGSSVTSLGLISLLRRVVSLIGVVGFIGLAGCVSVKTEHRVEPIQITMDVNVRLERELEDAFGDLDARSREIAKQQGQNITK